MLTGAGFENVINVNGGIKAWQGTKAAGPVELNMDIIRGDESSQEILTLGVWFEKGLQKFYRQTSDQTDEPTLKSLLTHLAGIEDRHIKTLFDLLKTVDPSINDRPLFEAGIKPKMMEGGYDIDLFMKENASYLKTPEGVLDLAMMLETQALDLYLRFAEKSTHSQTKEMLYKIADEEKSHLASLGRIREGKSERL
jgi:sulfur-carrier protein adenylyltransferase/sulfurtransferase